MKDWLGLSVATTQADFYFYFYFYYDSKWPADTPF